MILNQSLKNLRHHYTITMMKLVKAAPTALTKVQVNGKMRDKFEAERDFPEEKIKQKALDLRQIQKYLENREPKKVIYIKNKLINIVV